MVKQAISDLGENIVIKRFARFKVGEVAGGAGPSESPFPANQ